MPRPSFSWRPGRPTRPQHSRRGVFGVLPALEISCRLASGDRHELTGIIVEKVFAWYQQPGPHGTQPFAERRCLAVRWVARSTRRDFCRDNERHRWRCVCTGNRRNGGEKRGGPGWCGGAGAGGARGSQAGADGGAWTAGSSPSPVGWSRRVASHPVDAFPKVDLPPPDRSPAPPAISGMPPSGKNERTGASQFRFARHVSRACRPKATAHR
ncbi:hypothetical protein SETIT_1G306200v2 [Setaria italica]|uniref:Uncharacterized protein n=1 Tax=Setaria italica TaxID=4555 RepID=A0A368PRW4_SETIT|nr:hypothetical protein SETIT_1G306200v2 [Setaria italica]